MINQIFVQAHFFAETTSGDITPQQQWKLDELKAELKILVEEQVTQNML